MDPPPAVRHRSGLERSAASSDPLSQTDQPVAGADPRQGRIARGPAIDHIDDEPIRLAVDDHGDAGPGGVAQRVREPFLDDAVRGLDESSRKSLTIALEPERHMQSTGPGTCDELVDELEIRRGADRLLVA